jgi:HlyD family type I secretion membrane fusion protein
MNKLEWGLKRTIGVGLGLLIGLGVIFVVWGVLSKVELSVVGPGEIISSSYRKVVRAPEGGIVKELYVKEGDFVKEGAPLIKLDDAEYQIRLTQQQQLYRQLLAERARIEAELEGKGEIQFPAEVPEGLRRLQRGILETNRQELARKLEELRLKGESLRADIAGLEEGIKLKEQVLASYREELAKWKPLYQKNLVGVDKVNQLQRQIDSLEAQLAEARNKIVQDRKNLLQVENQIRLTKVNHRKELLARLDQIQKQLPQILQTIGLMRDRIRKSLITSPGEGYVYNLEVHAPGEVVGNNQFLMFIAPPDKNVTIQVRIDPTDIDKVYPDENATIQFPSYVDPSARPVEGVVTYVSPDIVTQKDGKSFYIAYVKITPAGMEAIRRNGFQLKLGMPVTVFIKAGERSFASYILIPLQQMMKKAFHAN